MDKVLGRLTLSGDLAGHGDAGGQDHGAGLLDNCLKERQRDEEKGLAWEKFFTMYMQAGVHSRTVGGCGCSGGDWYSCRAILLLGRRRTNNGRHNGGKKKGKKSSDRLFETTCSHTGTGPPRA